jgi:hypothetical protein
MSLAEQVRAHFVRTRVDPTKLAGERIVKVAVNALKQELRWDNRFPVICSALTARRFHESMGVRLLGATVPCPSSTTVLTFSIQDEEADRIACE